MAVSVAAVMRQINNYFQVGSISGRIAISGNAIAPAPESPWCFVSGSWMHDGAWQVTGGVLQDMDGALPDEEFDGRVWLLKPPPDFLALCEEISRYDDKNSLSGLKSERFGDYSYTRGTDAGWERAFAARLAPFRRMVTEVC